MCVPGFASPFEKDITTTGSGAPTDSFELITIFKTLSANTVIFWGGGDFQHRNFEGTQFRLQHLLVSFVYLLKLIALLPCASLCYELRVEIKIGLGY